MLYSLTLRSWCESSRWWVRKSKACCAFWVYVLLCTVCVCIGNCVCFWMCAYFLLWHSGKEDFGMVERPLMYQLQYCVFVCGSVLHTLSKRVRRTPLGAPLYSAEQNGTVQSNRTLHKEFTEESHQLRHQPIWTYCSPVHIFIFSLTRMIRDKKRSLLLLNRTKWNVKIKHVIQKACHRRFLLSWWSSTLLTQDVVNLWDVYPIKYDDSPMLHFFKP